MPLLLLVNARRRPGHRLLIATALVLAIDVVGGGDAVLDESVGVLGLVQRRVPAPALVPFRFTEEGVVFRVWFDCVHHCVRFFVWVVVLRVGLVQC